MFFEPLDLMARLAARVLEPHVNLICCHGAHRAAVTPIRRGRSKPTDAQADRTLAQQRAAMPRAQRLERVFNIDLESREVCGGMVAIIASIAY